MDLNSKSIKNRLFQVINNKPNKHTFLLEHPQHETHILKPKKIQEESLTLKAKTNPIYKSGKLLLNNLASPEMAKKKPK